MKLKFNLKLTIVLVSLFVGFLLLIFGNQNKYCQSFGFIFLAIGIIFLAVDRTKQIDKLRIKIDNQLNSDEDLDDESLLDLNNESNRLYKQKMRINIASYSCATLFILAGLFILI